ncbi:MAG: SusC/RagA family TonB-linked outer membrane protein [Bacteroidota bacterium]|nr:SusC/RagA family TonB-linked outer membrane protein [Bacteroidota bacterium]
MKKIALLFVIFAVTVASVVAQRSVTGTVTDEGGSPIPGVTVVVKDVTGGTITDLNGNYSINVPGSDNILIFTYIGLETQEIRAKDKATINVSMSSKAEEIDVVVVTAVGVRKSEKKIGYAATSVGGDEITKTQDRSAINALSGKVAGVNISSASGAPGSSTRVIFRGFSTFNGSNQPLYVIDGVPINNSASGSTSLNGGTDFGNQGNDINPDDIAEITFLKGSGATALYGSRAANGVIVITTKKGQSGKNKKTEISVTSTAKFSTPLRIPQLQNIYGQGIFGNWDQRENTSYGPKFDDELHYWGHVVDGERLIKPYSSLENNVSDFFEIGRTYQNSVSLSGGNENSSYYMSFSNVNDDGIFPEDKDSYKRNTFSLRGSTKLSNNFSSTASLNYINKKNKFVPTGQGGQSVWNNILQQPRDIPILELSNYQDKFYDNDTYYSPYTTNPYWPLMENGNQNNEDRVYGSAQISYRPTDKLNFMFRTGTDVSNRQLKEWRAKKINSSAADGGFNEGVDTEEGVVEEYSQMGNQLNTDFIATYNDKFEDFDISFMVGHNMNQKTYRSQYAGATGIDIEGFYDLSNTYGTPSVYEYSYTRRLIGVFGNFEVNYKGWLNLQLSDRNDWSSTLPTENRSFNYPGVNIGFVYSDAFKAIKKIIPYGKFRVSWGKTGNDAGIYQVYPIFSQPYRFPLPGNVNAFSVGNRIGNPNLRPELTSELEIGTDLRFWENRVKIDFSVYEKTITDLIFDVELAGSSGYTVQTMNVGEITNKGVEVLVSLVPVKMENFEWNFSVNFAKNISNVDKLPDELDHVDIMGLLGGTEHWFRAYEGRPIGIFETSAPKTWTDDNGEEHLVVNSQGIPMLADEGYVESGTSEHDFIAGFTTGFRIYKMISISASVDWRQGGVMHSRTAGMVYFTGIAPQTLYNDRQPFIVPGSVMQQGIDNEGNPIYVENTRPVLYESLGGSADSYFDRGATMVGEHEIVDKSFIKLRSASISFNMPKKWLEITPFGSASVSMIGTNLLLWTPESNNFIDPEATTYGNDLMADFGEFGATPSVRTVGFSLSFKF